VTLTAESWNTVYTTTLVDVAAGDSYVLNNFRSENVTLESGPAVAGQAQSLVVNGAQNGSVTLGSGNQNVTINAGLGGASPSTSNTFIITDGTGADSLTVNGYAGYLPASNIANITQAIVYAGAATADMTFINAHVAVYGGSGSVTVHGSNYGTHFTAGTGTADIWGGSYYNTFNYAAGDGLMTIEDFSADDTLVLDDSLKTGMTAASITGGVELLFSSSPNSEILLKGATTANYAAHLTWS
jgi:hypothetical protein